MAYGASTVSTISKSKVLAIVVVAIVLLAAAGYWMTRPVEQKTFVFQFYETQPTWDPSEFFDSTIVSMENLYEPMLYYNRPGSAEMFTPALATSWESSPDGMTWTFHLRQGVKFHSDNLMTAEDVKFSIDRTIRMGKGAAWIWSSVQEIDVIDDYTVEFKLKYAAALDLIASSSYGAMIMDSKLLTSIGDDAATNAWFMEGKEAGTGPYKLEKYVRGVEVYFVKYGDYWGGWKPNQIERAVLKIVEEPTTIVQMIEGGEVHLINGPPIESMDRLKENTGLQVVVRPSFKNTWIDLNVQKDPTNDVLVRKAIAYSFPYDDVVKEVLKGYATQARGPVPEGVWGRKSDLYQYTYDPEKARQLLADAGWTDANGDGVLEKDGKRLSVRIAASSGESYRKTVELWRTTLTELGFDVTVEITPWDTHWTRGKSLETAAEIWFLGWWPTYITPYDQLFEFYTEKEPFFNMAYYSSPEFDAVLDEALAMEGTDKTKATELYGRAQEILIEDCPAIFAFDQMDIYVVSNQISGFEPNPAYPNVVFLYELYWK